MFSYYAIVVLNFRHCILLEWSKMYKELFAILRASPAQLQKWMKFWRGIISKQRQCVCHIFLSQGHLTAKFVASRLPISFCRPKTLSSGCLMSLLNHDYQDQCENWWRLRWGGGGLHHSSSESCHRWQPFTSLCLCPTRNSLGQWRWGGWKYDLDTVTWGQYAW